MCGIFGYIGKQHKAATIVLDGIKALEYRGYDSWGVGIIPQGQIDHIVIKKNVGKINNATVDDMPNSSLGIGHTRWATHGGVTKQNAHPHLDCTNTIALIHNGIIENYEELKTHLSGHTFVSETDSEIAVHMIEVALRTMPLAESVRTTFNQFRGSNALVVIEKHTDAIVAIRNGSPLVVGYGNNEQFVASDATGLLPYTKRVHFLENNEMCVLTRNEITCSHATTGKTIRVTPLILNTSAQAATKRSYATFMEKEIHEQPTILTHILTNKNITSTLCRAIRSAKGSYLTGCGSAYYACLAGSYLFATVAKHHINTCVASEFTYQEDFLTRKSLVIALSQSGETMDLIDAVTTAQKHKATLASLVNVEGSTLWRMSTIPIACHAGPEMSVASTKDLIAKLGILLLSAYTYADREHEGKRILKKSIAATKKLFKPSAQTPIRQLAKRIASSSNLFVVGRGLSYPAALEIAMKIKEISYIHAEGFAAGELKHGPIALIEQHTPCIVLVPQDETVEANLAAAMEMKARGGYIIGISPIHHPVFDCHLMVDNVGTGTIIPMIVEGQLLAYFLAQIKHLDPDKPRNLAKSVTVK